MGMTTVLQFVAVIQVMNNAHTLYPLPPPHSTLAQIVRMDHSVNNEMCAESDHCPPFTEDTAYSSWGVGL